MPKKLSFIIENLSLLDSYRTDALYLELLCLKVQEKFPIRIDVRNGKLPDHLRMGAAGYIDPALTVAQNIRVIKERIEEMGATPDEYQIFNLFGAMLKINSGGLYRDFATKQLHIGTAFSASWVVMFVDFIIKGVLPTEGVEPFKKWVDEEFAGKDKISKYHFRYMHVEVERFKNSRLIISGLNDAEQKTLDRILMLAQIFRTY